MYHYVYRISHLLKGKHYYGTRSSKCKPLADLGIKYFSSSSDKEFIHEQHTTPENFKYKVVREFSSRVDAITLEVALHTKFNVGVSPMFYNKVCQTTTKFDVTGCSFNKGTTPVVEVNTGKSFRANVGDPRFKTGEIVSVTKGKFLNTVMVYLEDGTCTRVPNTHPKWLDGTYIHPSKGTTRSQEAIEAQRAKMLGREMPEKQKVKLRNAMTQDRKNTISANNKGKHPPVTRSYKLILTDGTIYQGTQIEVAKAIGMCTKTLRKFDRVIELTSSGQAKRDTLNKPNVQGALIESTKYKGKS